MTEDLCYEVLILLSQLGVGDLLACWMAPLGFVAWDFQFQIGSILAELYILTDLLQAKLVCWTLGSGSHLRQASLILWSLP